MSRQRLSFVDCVGGEVRCNLGIKRAFTLEALLGEQGSDQFLKKNGNKKGLALLS